MKSLRLFFLYFLLIFTLSIPQPAAAYEAGLVFPATGSWNGFNNHFVVAECLNVGPQPVSMRIEVFRNSGAFLNQRDFVVSSFGTTHIILNDLQDSNGNSISNDHGTYILRVLGLDDSEVTPVVSCLTSHYRSRPGSNVPEYAFAIPVTNGDIATTSGIYNSFDPASPWNQGNEVPTQNWLTIINTDSVDFGGVVEVYSALGELVEQVEVSLTPSARTDIPLGFTSGQKTGIYRIVSTNGVGYSSFVSRYHTRNGRNYNFALYTKSVAGGCDLELPASTMNGFGNTAVNWLEIGNPSVDPVAVDIHVKNSFGQVVHSERRTIPAFGMDNMAMNPYIDSAGTGNIGSVSVSCSDPDEKLILQTAFYGLPAAGEAEMGWAYISQAVQGPGAKQGEALVGGANTFLNAFDWMKLVNGESETTGLNVQVFDGAGALRGGISASIPGGGTFDFGVHEYLPADNIGVVVASTGDGAASVKGELVRVFIDEEGRVAEIMPTPLIAVERNEDGNLDPIFTGEVSLAPYRDSLSDAEIRHLFNRLSLGYSEEMLNYARQNGLRKTVARLMNGPADRRACLEKALAAAKYEMRRDCAFIEGTLYCTPQVVEWRVNAIANVRLDMMINCPWNGFHENMGIFWSDHFGVSEPKDESHTRQHFIYEWYNMTLGKVNDSDPVDPFLFNTTWAEFLQEVTKTGAMIGWLNLYNNVFQLPNEDFARELQELYSIGDADPFTGVDRYNDSTEIAAIARVMTGLFYARRSGEFGRPHGVCSKDSNGDYTQNCRTYYQSYDIVGFDSSRWMEDPENPVQITVYEGRPYQATQSFDYLTFIDFMVENHPGVPNYLAEQVLGHWVLPDYGPEVRNQLSGLIRSNEFKLGEAIKTAVQSKAMFSPKSKSRNCVKWPVEIFVPLFKNLGLPLIRHEYLDSNNNERSIDMYDYLRDALADAGMRLDDAGIVFGYGGLAGRCGDHRAGKRSFGEPFLSSILEVQRNLMRIMEKLDDLRDVTEESSNPLFKWSWLLPEGDNVTAAQVVEHFLRKLNLYHRYTAQERAVLERFLTHAQVTEDENAEVFNVGWNPQSSSFEEYLSIKIPNLIQILVLDERYFTG